MVVTPGRECDILPKTVYMHTVTIRTLESYNNSVLRLRLQDVPSSDRRLVLQESYVSTCIDEAALLVSPCGVIPSPDGIALFSFSFCFLASSSS